MTEMAEIMSMNGPFEGDFNFLKIKTKLKYIYSFSSSCSIAERLDIQIS
jgi:hypothetical protein